MSNFHEIPSCQFHSLCGGWCEAPDQIHAGLCENCLGDAAYDDQCRALMQQRVSLALMHIDQLINECAGDGQARAIALALVNQMITLGHLNASSADGRLQRIRIMATASDQRSIA